MINARRVLTLLAWSHSAQCLCDEAQAGDSCVLAKESMLLQKFGVQNVKVAANTEPPASDGDSSSKSQTPSADGSYAWLKKTAGKLESSVVDAVDHTREIASRLASGGSPHADGPMSKEDLHHREVAEMFLVLAFCVCCILPLLWCAVIAWAGSRASKISEVMEDLGAEFDALGEQEAEYLKSDLFLKKCEEAFRIADKDKSGKLDREELATLDVFDLAPDEKAQVKKHHLFDHAFVTYDKNNDNVIDEEEFKILMTWVHAAARVAKFQENAAGRSPKK